MIFPLTTLVLFHIGDKCYRDIECNDANITIIIETRFYLLRLIARIKGFQLAERVRSCYHRYSVFFNHKVKTHEGEEALGVGHQLSHKGRSFR